MLGKKEEEEKEEEEALRKLACLTRPGSYKISRIYLYVQS